MGRAPRGRWVVCWPKAAKDVKDNKRPLRTSPDLKKEVIRIENELLERLMSNKKSTL
jgi:hypothetical protein